MIRRMLRLALEAVKARLAPEPAPTPPPAPAPIVSKWGSSAYHVEVLGSSVCPGCEKPKAVGWYWCKPCVAQKRAEA